MSAVPAVAGGVVVGPHGQLVLACQQGRSWSLPKGHVEPGESTLDAARREIAEESGIHDLTLIGELGSYVRSTLGPDGRIRPSDKLLTCYLFTTSTEADLDPSDPDNPEAIWAPLPAAVRLLTHPADAEFLAGAADRIRTLVPKAAQPTGAPLPRHTAVILAAGLGSRLGPRTDQVPKCLTPVDGVPLLLRSLDALAAAGVRSFLVAVGHLGAQVVDAVTRNRPQLAVRFAWNRDYARTGTAGSLRCALGELDPCDALILVEGDVVFDRRAADRLFAHTGSVTAVEPYREGLSGTFVQRAGDGTVTCVSHASWRSADTDLRGLDKTVNLHAFAHADQTQTVLPVLAELLDREPAAHLEHLLRDCVQHGLRIRGVDVGDLPWCEVDDETDLAVANRIFGAEPAARSAGGPTIGEPPTGPPLVGPPPAGQPPAGGPRSGGPAVHQRGVPCAESGG